MRWIYGKQDWKDLERGQENCYLLTNGLGGFSSLTMMGSAARNDHALLMGCVHAPNRRYNMVHRLSERLRIGERELCLSSQEFADGSREEGYRYLSAFVFEDVPLWKFQAQGVEIRKEIALKQGENTVAVRYEIRNGSREKAALSVTPFFQFAPKGSEPEEGQRLIRCGNAVRAEESVPSDGAVEHSGMEQPGGMELFFETNGEIEDIPAREERYYYSYDGCDGRRETGRASTNHMVVMRASAGETAVLWIVYSMEKGGASFGDMEWTQGDPAVRRSGKTPARDADAIIREQKEYCRELERRAGFDSPAARALSKSANQFVARRESTDGSTILAGYPFFEDWGRDTMIALPGVCISAGQYETAKEILRTFAAYERNGLMPNLFPEGGKEPLYNTADAALLFINCVYLYYRAAGDAVFVREMYPVMERIIEAYRQGTDYGIYMDEDGLIHSGEGLWQVTWMDVRVGEILPTPRHGKPVEINAYWYNALCIMEELAPAAGRETAGQLKYRELRERARRSFREKFWLKERHCLRDLVSGTSADRQLRCNQIWAVSLPFTMLEPEQERQVVETVFEKLYTPYGLRTLEEDDPEFHPFYGGPMEERDMAYHQGTVWTFPLGAYYLAYLKVHGYSREAKAVVWDQLEVLEAAFREGCIGQLPEIYDGGVPTRSKGCFAQAWSTGEILRVYEALERH